MYSLLSSSDSMDPVAYLFMTSVVYCQVLLTRVQITVRLVLMSLEDVPGGWKSLSSYCFRINNLVSDPAPSFCPQQHGCCHLMKSPSTWLGTWREVPSATLLLPWNQSRGSPSRPLYMSLAAWQEVIYELFSWGRKEPSVNGVQQMQEMENLNILLNFPNLILIFELNKMILTLLEWAKFLVIFQSLLWLNN